MKTVKPGPTQRVSFPGVTHVLFTYGSLRKGAHNHRRVADNPFLGAGFVAGKLWDLGSFPGLVPGRGTVFGEMYALSDQELESMDWFEGANTNPPFYIRERRTVRLEGKRTVSAWVYRYGEKMYPSQGDVVGGDWIKYLHAHKPHLVNG